MFKTMTFGALASVVALVACQQPSAESSNALDTEVASVQVADQPLPAIDGANATQFVSERETFIPLEFARAGSTVVEGAVTGATAPIYAVPVAAGQTLTVKLRSESTNLYFNVSNATDHSGAALHRGEIDGATATLDAERDMTLMISPFQPRATARRDKAATYTLAVSRE